MQQQEMLIHIFRNRTFFCSAVITLLTLNLCFMQSCDVMLGNTMLELNQNRLQGQVQADFLNPGGYKYHTQ